MVSPALMISIQKISHSGKSLHVVIPRAILKALKMRKGDTVIVAMETGRVVIKRVDERDLLRLTVKLPPPPVHLDDLYSDEIKYRSNLKFKLFNYYCDRQNLVAKHNIKDSIVSILIRKYLRESI